MARAQGARALRALAFETTSGTPPASGFTRMPCNWPHETVTAISPFESIAIIAVGYGVAVLTQFLTFPVFQGIVPTAKRMEGRCPRCKPEERDHDVVVRVDCQPSFS